MTGRSDPLELISICGAPGKPHRRECWSSLEDLVNPKFTAEDWKYPKGTGLGQESCLSRSKEDTDLSHRITGKIE